MSAQNGQDEQTVRNATRPFGVGVAQTYPDLHLLAALPGPRAGMGNPPVESVKLVVNGGIKLITATSLFFGQLRSNIQTNESFNYRSAQDGHRFDRRKVQ